MMSRRAGLFLVVTFAEDLTRGNPAYVLTETGPASDAALASMCDLLGTGIIAVIDGLAQAAPLLRFFTPDGPHPGAGHAALAAAHVVFRGRLPNGTTASMRNAVLRTPAGELRIAEETDGRIAIALPMMRATSVDTVEAMAGALGARPTETLVSPFGYVGIFANAETVAALRPDRARVAAFDRNALIATAPGGGDADVVVRVFAPKVGLPEDPVCGTAHRIIIPYWTDRIGQRRLHSRHLSPRGGDLWCEVEGSTVRIAGTSRLAVEGTADLPS